MLPQKRAYLLGLGVATAVIPTTILFLLANLLLFVPLFVGLLVLCLGMWSGNSDKTERFASALVLFAWIGPFLITAYLNRSWPPVVFVIPDGYHGTIEIIQDREQGIDMRLEHGMFTIEVPASGVVRLKDTSPFRHWHEERCREIDGTPRQLVDQGSQTCTGLGNHDDCITYRWQVHQ